MRAGLYVLMMVGAGLAPSQAMYAQEAGIPLEAGLNREVLKAVAAMPQGGGYIAGGQATRAFTGSMKVGATGLILEPQTATPSYCSAATYQVFLRVLQKQAEAGNLALEPAQWTTLLARGQRDGDGIWGRWNANGPGTARLFYELDLGKNFTRFELAQPGDFMKIFWTGEIGAREHGHSVVYLGRQTIVGVEHIRFWSSNQPGGYGQKSVPRSKVAFAIFSRLEKPGNLQRVTSLSKSDRYLGSLLKVSTSLQEVSLQCGLR